MSVLDECYELANQKCSSIQAKAVEDGEKEFTTSCEDVSAVHSSKQQTWFAGMSGIWEEAKSSRTLHPDIIEKVKAACSSSDLGSRFNLSRKVIGDDGARLLGRVLAAMPHPLPFQECK